MGHTSSNGSQTSTDDAKLLSQAENNLCKVALCLSLRHFRNQGEKNLALRHI